MDSGTAEQLLDIMHKLNRERAVTFIFSTHDARVMDHAQRVVRLVDGQVASDETQRGEESSPVPPPAEILDRG